MTFNRLLPVLAALFLSLLAVSCSGGDGDTTGGIPDPGTLNPEQLAPEVQVQMVDMRFRTAGRSDENLGVDPVPGIIAAARTSLDIALPRLNRQEIVTQLLAAANRGVQVRIVTEQGYREDPTYAPFYDQLEDITRNAGNIQVETDLEGFPRLMHSRFIIVDQSRVVTGSYTWESADFDRTIGDVISILHTGVAAAFLNQFNQMFSEGNFGIHKRDETVHTFLVGNNSATLEVYFGPTDKPRDLMETEILQSTNVHVAVQQFKDFSLGQTLANWVAGNENRQLYLALNNFKTNGTDEDTALYNAFANFVAAPPADSGRLILAGMGVDSPLSARLEPFVNFATMNHKLLFADHGQTDQVPAIMSTSANFDEVSFTLNDEVILIMRGAPLVNKYIRGPFSDHTGTRRWGLNYQSIQPSNSLRVPQDFQELDALALMLPYISSDATETFRLWAPLPAALLTGEVSNFRRNITIQTQDGESEELEIDVAFTIEGTTFFGDTLESIFGENADEMPIGNLAGEAFNENETANPDHRFQAVIPAGTYTLRTYVTVDGEADPRFTPSETPITIGPGGIRDVRVQINQAISGTGPGGGGVQ
jgi:hypothetical protein